MLATSPDFRYNPPMTFADALARHFPAADGFAADRQLGEDSLRIPHNQLLAAAKTLRDHPDFQFAQLTDLCGVDYSQYAQGRRGLFPADALHSSHSHPPLSPTPPVPSGPSDSGTESHSGPDSETDSGSAGTDLRSAGTDSETRPRFAVVCHLLSLQKNRRIRLRVFCSDGEPPAVDSLCEIWPAANWFEREAFDLFGIVFRGHPDLRRILTDYGFIGHPFRKDFPLSGHVEMRYDPDRRRVVYQPVSIPPREETPRVVREPEFAGGRN